MKKFFLTTLLVILPLAGYAAFSGKNSILLTPNDTDDNYALSVQYPPGSGTTVFNLTKAGAISTPLIFTGGLVVSGGNSSINDNSNFTTKLGTGTSTGAITIGGGSNTVQVNSSSWKVSTSGAASGLTTIGASGLASLSGGLTVTGTTATGLTTTGTITASGLITANLGITTTAAVTLINKDSNFNTEINTGGSTGAVLLGAGSGNILLNGASIDVTGTSTIRSPVTFKGAAPIVLDGTGTYGVTANIASITTARNIYVGDISGGLPLFQNTSSTVKMWDVSDTVLNTTTSTTTTVTGLTASSKCVASPNGTPTNANSIIRVVPGSGNVQVVVSTDPGANGQGYTVICAQ